MNTSYTWLGGTELMFQVGEDAPVQIILIPPLFDEANRMRKTLADVTRQLHANGFGVALPDLPGTGESVTALHDNSFVDWRAALAALADTRGEGGKKLVTASFRGGALLDADAKSDGVWRLAEETGARLLRDISRTVMARTAVARDENVFDRAGYPLPLGLITALTDAIPQPVSKLRTVRLHQDPHEADARIAGSPLWRRSEPGDDPVLTAAIVEDITGWARQCAA